MGRWGCDYCFSANPGQAVAPLAKIASSGEIARVFLAVKAVLAKVDSTPMLVFDEVDANIGGEVGREVGKQLALLAKNHQVFCITHLPQVATPAQAHFFVQKSQTASQTKIQIMPIHEDSKLREAEIARMLGDRSSKIALEHARELLNSSKL